MKNKHLYKILFAFFVAVLLMSCRDDFAKLNTSPSGVVEPDINYLFTKALMEFEPAGYQFWFYNARYTTHWTQAYVSTGSNSDRFNEMGALGNQGLQTYSVLRYFREIEYVLSHKDKEEAAAYEHTRNMFKPLLVYLALFDTDMLGDFPYTEAGKARFTNPPILTPKFDKMSDLYETFLKELDEAIAVLSKPVMLGEKTVAQNSLGAQDLIYNGDATKWAKLANSLKLKIAVRLLHQDFEKAKKIAQEVVESPVGVMGDNADDFILFRGNNQYHLDGGNNRTNLGAPSMQVVDYMLDCKDPRVRFFFQKNQFSSRVIQGFFDVERELPKYIEDNVETELVEGKKKFKSWKGLGEPWVRYYGLPVEVQANLKGEYKDYFEAERWKIKIGDKDKTFYPCASYNEYLVNGDIGFTVPDVPGAPVVEETEKRPWHGLFMSAAETNLYLAELKLIGANLPGTAEEYLKKAVSLSVKAYDNLASLNKVPYYHKTYDPQEKSIKLESGEIENLLTHSSLKLTGDKKADLEKVYIQQFLHFYMLPNDQFVSSRRSGVPMKGSNFLPFEKFSSTVDYVLPRRFEIPALSKTDLMYAIKEEAYSRQGFTLGNTLNPSILNSERIWFDKGAPNFGEGPNF